MKLKQITVRQSLALLAAAAMTAAAGCSGNPSADPSQSPVNSVKPSATADANANNLPHVQLTWYYGIGEQQQDQQLIEDEVNKYLKDKTKLNATVKLKPVDFGSYDQKMNVTLASGEPIDIIWTTATWLLKYNENINKGAFLAIDDLLPKYAPKVYNEVVPKPYWSDLKADTDGKIYAIPNFQLAATAFSVTFNKKFVDKYNFDLKQVKKLSDIEPYLEQLKKNEPAEVVPFAFGANNNGPHDPDYELHSGLMWYNKKDPGQNVGYYESPQYKEHLELMRSWYSKGYIYKDLATVKDMSQLDKKLSIAVNIDVTSKPGGDIENSVRAGYEIVSQRITQPTFTGVKATMNAISKTSKNPERALMFLELVNTDKELYRLLSYGIKDQHYKEDNGYVKPIEGSKYNPNTFWVFGNPNNSLLTEGQPADLVDQIAKYNAEAEIPPLYGFKFDTTELKTEMAAINAVKAEYLLPLETGTVEPATVLPKFLDALKKAGMDKVKAEWNKQLAAWMAKK